MVLVSASAPARGADEGTFSIIARDPATGELGMGVHSKAHAVGSRTISAKGGVAVAIAHDLKIPIRYVGVGEGLEDLVPFDAAVYVDALFVEKW